MPNSAIDFARIWSGKLERIKRLLKRLPRDVGNEALLFFNNQFKKAETPEGDPWEPRKSGGEGRALLVKSGRLRKSIRLTKVTSNSVTIGSNVLYAKYHNDGTEVIPQRQFLGKSIALSRRLQRIIKAKILWELRK